MCKCSDRLVLTGGASYGIMNILAQTTCPYTYTKQAFIISPTYYLINATFYDAGFGGKLTAIDEEENGVVDFEYLINRLEYYDSLPDPKFPVEDDKDHIHQGTWNKGRAPFNTIDDPARPTKKVYRYVMYCVPTYSNPRGGVFSLETRKKLLDLARKHDILIISDDVYDLLAYETPPYLTAFNHPIPRFVTLDADTIKYAEPNEKSSYPVPPGNTISNLTFSKLAGPGLRVGWQETPTSYLAELLAIGGANKSGGSPSQLNSFIVATLIKEGLLDSIIENLKDTYSKRSSFLKECLNKYLPKGTLVEGGYGGYFLWVTIPDSLGLDARVICKKCSERGVILANGDEFEVTGDEKHWGKKSVRLSVSYLELDQIEKGAKIWGEVIDELLK